MRAPTLLSTSTTSAVRQLTDWGKIRGSAQLRLIFKCRVEDIIVFEDDEIDENGNSNK